MTYRILPNALHFSEFQGGYHGTCGETALATALVCSTPQIEATPDAIALLLSLTKEMIALGWASSSGSTTTQHLFDEAKRRGFTPDLASFIAFRQPLPDSAAFHSLLLSTAGIKPIIIEIAQGGNLPGDETGLQYHFICIVGITDAGYICNDGDNPNSPNHLVTYSWAQLESAVPCGVLVVEMQNQGANPMPVPAGWSDNGKDTLHDPNGIPVIGAMRAYVLSHSWDPGDTPMGPEQEVEQVEMGNPALAHKGVVQFFRVSGQLSWDGSFNGGAAWRTWNGQEENALRGNLAAALAQINTLRQQLQSPPPATPTPVDPTVKAALQAAAQALAPQVALAQELADAVAKL